MTQILNTTIPTEFRNAMQWSIVGVSGGAVLSNCLVFLLIMRHRPLRSKGTAYVGSLASADLVFSAALLSAQFFPSKEVIPPSLCAVLYTLIPWSSMASPWSLLAITVDRYIFISTPLDYNRLVGRKLVTSTILTLWTTSLGFTLLTLIPWPTNDPISKKICGDIITKTYPYLITYVALVSVPVLFVALLYLRILNIARQSYKSHESILLVPKGVSSCQTADDQMSNADTDQHQGEEQVIVRNVSTLRETLSPRRCRRVANSTRMFFILTIVFFIFWLPVNVCFCMLCACAQCRQMPEMIYALYISIFLYVWTPLLNPWVYTLRNREFRVALNRLLFSTSQTTFSDSETLPRSLNGTLESAVE